MKVEPFLLASTLRAVIAQRLVRRLCPVCRAAVAARETVAPLLGIDPAATVHVARGCEACGHSGYRGRIGVFEGVRVDETVRRLINEGGDEAAIAAHAFARTPTLAEAARGLVLAGETTAEEAVRVSRRDASDPELAVEEERAVAPIAAPPPVDPHRGRPRLWGQKKKKEKKTAKKKRRDG